MYCASVAALLATGGCVSSVDAYLLGGRITGLKGTIVLDNKNIQQLTQSSDGDFTFLGSKLSGTDYDVTIATQPVGQTCVVSGGQGIFGDRDARQVLVTCGKVITFGSWNIQNFGTSKASKSSVMDLISQVMMRFDVLFIQEVSTVGGGVGSCGANSILEICSLLARVNSADRAGAGAYAVTTSPTSGAGGTAEKYAVFYRTSLASVTENVLVTNIPAEGSYTRPPMVVRINIGSQNLYVLNIHTSPSVATQEILDLPKAANARYQTDQEIMIVGDMNAAAGGGFNQSTGWPTYFATFNPSSPTYLNEITDSMDTTVAQGNAYSYDRMTLSPKLQAKVKPSSAGPYYFDGFVSGAAVACTSSEAALMAAIITQGCGSWLTTCTCNGAALQVSDHYPVSLQMIY
jgi:endonuclease/exonuclease/phosphatase family metal-dependent hydrolase